MKSCADCHPCSLCTRSADAPNVAWGARPSDRPCEGRGGCKRGPRVTRAPPDVPFRIREQTRWGRFHQPRELPAASERRENAPVPTRKNGGDGPRRRCAGRGGGSSHAPPQRRGTGWGAVSSEVGEAGGGDSDINPPGPQVTERAPDRWGLGSGDGGGGAML